VSVILWLGRFSFIWVLVVYKQKGGWLVVFGFRALKDMCART